MPRKRSGQAREHWQRFTLDDGELQLLEAALAAQQVGRPGLKMMGYIREIVLERAEKDAAGAHDALRQYAASRQVNMGALVAAALRDPEMVARIADALEIGNRPKKG